MRTMAIRCWHCIVFRRNNNKPPIMKLQQKQAFQLSRGACSRRRFKYRRRAWPLENICLVMVVTSHETRGGSARAPPTVRLAPCVVRVGPPCPPGWGGENQEGEYIYTGVSKTGANEEDEGANEEDEAGRIERRRARHHVPRHFRPQSRGCACNTRKF